MALKQLGVRIDDALIAEFDAARGAIPRAAAVSQAMRLWMDALASVTPEDLKGFSIGGLAVDRSLQQVTSAQAKAGVKPIER